VSTKRIILTSLATVVAIVILAVVAIVLSDEQEVEFGPKPVPVYNSADSEFAYTAATKLQEGNYLAELALMNTDNLAVLELAREARTAQNSQLAVIESWLTETRQPAIFDYDPEFGLAEVLTSVELLELEAARDGEFDALWLDAVRRHNLLVIELSVGYLAAFEGSTESFNLEKVAREIFETTQDRQELIRALP
jgi:uncharacterized protein (DUF305 family)